jgi:hypothetical protein
MICGVVFFFFFLKGKAPRLNLVLMYIQKGHCEPSLSKRGWNEAKIATYARAELSKQYTT